MLPLFVVASLAVMLLYSPVAEAQPEVTATYPADGDVLAKAPPIIRICFADSVNVRNLTEGGDFGFTVTAPEEKSLGLRIVFKIDGLGVDLFAGSSSVLAEGDWVVDWRVTDPETLDPATGTIRFTVGPEGDPVPEEPPISCTGGEPMGSSTPVDVTPDATEPDEDGSESDGGTDTLRVAVIVAGAVGSVVLALILLLARGRKRST